ncbi:MAG: LysM domain-containing protein, partial [Chloroflexota bacterium]
MTHRLFEKSRIIAVLLVSVLLVSGFVTVPIYNAKAAVCNQYYLVLPGDDLYKIGLKYGVDWQTLASVNGIPNPYSVQAGQTLCISSPINTVYPTTNVYPVNSTYPTNYTYPNTYYPQNS